MYPNQLTIPLIILSLMGTLGVNTCMSQGTPERRIREQWEVRNSTFRIRLTEREVMNPTSLHRFDYTFESSLNTSDNWREITTLRQDDDRKVPQSQARFVNEQIGFVFVGPRYAVTLDGGRSWAVWDAVTELPDWKRSYLYVHDVNVLTDGTGTLSLLSFSMDPKDSPRLITRDFGLQWAIQPPE
jgi:hypothetical protein